MFSRDGKMADLKDADVLSSMEFENDLINKYGLLNIQFETMNGRDLFDKFLNGEYILLPSGGITPEIAKAVKEFNGFDIGITTFPELNKDNIPDYLIDFKQYRDIIIKAIAENNNSLGNSPTILEIKILRLSQLLNIAIIFSFYPF